VNVNAISAACHDQLLNTERDRLGTLRGLRLDSNSGGTLLNYAVVCD